jgi:hypothetical protein
MKTFLNKSNLNSFKTFGIPRNGTPMYQFQKTKFNTVHKSKDSKEHKQIHEPEFLEMVQMYFDGASKYIDIPKYYLNLIKSTKAAIKFNFPLVKDDGTIQVIQAYRAQHSLHYLPTKGGTRYADHIGK